MHHTSTTFRWRGIDWSLDAGIACRAGGCSRIPPDPPGQGGTYARAPYFATDRGRSGRRAPVCAAPASAAGGPEREGRGPDRRAAEDQAVADGARGAQARQPARGRAAPAARPPATAGAPRVDTGVEVTKSGTTEVDIRGRRGRRRRCWRGSQRVGAQIRQPRSACDSIRAESRCRRSTEVAAWKDVRRIDVAVGFITAPQGRQPRPARDQGAEGGPARGAAAAARAPADQGPVVSEGDARTPPTPRARAATSPAPA